MKKLKIIVLAIILTITATFSFSQEKAVLKVNGSFKDECKYMTNVIEKVIEEEIRAKNQLMYEFQAITLLDEVMDSYNKICR